MKNRRVVSLLPLLALLLLAECQAQKESRTNPQTESGGQPLLRGTESASGRLPQPARNGSFACPGNIGAALDECARPLMDIIEGSVERWPRNSTNIEELCASFAVGEKCIRRVSRCSKGLVRTIISTFANSFNRVRRQECVREKFASNLAMTSCVEKNQETIRPIVEDATGRVAYTRSKFTDPVVKIRGLCCVVHNAESNLRELLSPKCLEGSKTIIRLYRTVLSDVLDLICLSHQKEKCKQTFVDYKLAARGKSSARLVSSIVRLLAEMG